MRINRFVRTALVVLFLGVIIYALFQLWQIDHNNQREMTVREELKQYKPTAPHEKNTAEEAVIVNQSILDLQQVNADIVGWVTLDGTRIDYPFVQTSDNDYYLRRDIYGDYLYAGTIFMDYRNAADFTDFSTVLYGHNMQNGSMLADIRRYADQAFFEANDSGWLYLAHDTHKLEVLAYLVVNDDDDWVYTVRSMDALAREAFLSYLEENARCYRTLSIEPEDTLVTFSTCTTAYGEKRHILVAKLMSK